MQARNGLFRLASRSGRLVLLGAGRLEAGTAWVPAGGATDGGDAVRRHGTQALRSDWRGRGGISPQPCRTGRMPRAKAVVPSGRLKSFLARASFRRPSRPRVGHQGSTAPRKAPPLRVYEAEPSASKREASSATGSPAHAPTRHSTHAPDLPPPRTSVPFRRRSGGGLFWETCRAGLVGRRGVRVGGWNSPFR